MKFALLKRTTFRKHIPMFWISQITASALTKLRKQFDVLVRKPFIYQHKYTRYVLQYYRFKVLEFLNKTEFSLLVVLIKSGFLTQYDTAKLIITKTFISVNFITIVNPKTLVQKNDLITIKPELKCIFFIKWLSVLFKLKIRRFFFYRQKWLKRRFRPFPKKSTWRLPNWIYKYIFYKQTIPRFLEVDWLSCSFFVLYDWTSELFFFQYLTLNLNIIATIRPLNWKYLT